MAESSQQPATRTNDTLPSSTHIQRLENRRTEPSGIVDVRPFQSRFTRVPEWIVQRSAVVDGILKRYGTQNNTSAQEADLVLVASSQAVPRDETPTFETATQTTTPSSVPIARASRPELTIQRSSTTTQPSVTPSTPQQSPQQGESQRQSPLTVKNSPAAPALQRTASPSPSLRLAPLTSPSSPSSTSSPPPSGQFRVSRKAIPLPKIQASTSSQTDDGSLLSTNTQAFSTLVSAKKDLGEEKSEDEDEASTITYSSMDASNHPPVAEEITPISHQSQNPEPSLIFPKRLSQSSTNNSENFASSSQLGIESVSTNQNFIKTDVSQQTINQPTLAREITSKLEIYQIPTQSLILPKRLQQESSTSESTRVTFEGNIEQSVKRDSSQGNFQKQNLAPSSINNTQPQSSIMGKEILKFPPQKSAKSLILPFPLSQTTNNSPNKSESSKVTIGKFFENQNLIQTNISQPTVYQSTRNQPTLTREFENQNLIQTDISQPTVYQSTRNQPTLTREIATQPEIYQSSTPSLILPKRLQQFSSTAESTPVIFEGNIEQSVKRDSSQGNFQKQNLAATQQSAKSLILPKHLSQSTKNSANKSELSKVTTRKIFENQNLIQTDISQPTVYQSTRNQPTLTREIATQPEISQTSTPSLILPKRLQQFFSTAESTPVIFEGNIEQSVKRDSSQGNFQKQNLAPVSINNTQPQSSLIGKEILTFPPQQSAKSLILPKRFQQENSQNYSISHVTLQDGIKQLPKQENSTQQNIAKVSTKTAQNQLPIVGEIASTLHKFRQPEPSLILPKRLSEASTSKAESSGQSRNLPTSTLQRKVGRSSSLKTSVVAIAPSAEPLRAIASEIPSTENSLEQQNMVWRKSVSTASSEDLSSHVSNSNHQAGMPLAINSVRGEPYIARQISTTSSPNSIATAEVNNPRQTTRATPAQTNTQTNEINVAQIAEQVSRILHRNLSIERERRGMNLWY